jgi:hypothetical protein
MSWKKSNNNIPTVFLNTIHHPVLFKTVFLWLDSVFIFKWNVTQLGQTDTSGEGGLQSGCINILS